MQTVFVSVVVVFGPFKRVSKAGEETVDVKLNFPFLFMLCWRCLTRTHSVRRALRTFVGGGGLHP